MWHADKEEMVLSFEKEFLQLPEENGSALVAIFRMR